MDNKKNDSKTQEHNWLDLAQHLQTKVNRRSSDMAFLQLRGGIILVAAILLLQAIVSMRKPWGLFIVVSVVLSVMSMMSGKTSSPLDPKETISQLKKEPRLTRRQFAEWMASSCAESNSRFNKIYNTKYNYQVAAVAALCAAVCLCSFRV
jgi:hypothetical protein